MRASIYFVAAILVVCVHLGTSNVWKDTPRRVAEDRFKSGSVKKTVKDVEPSKRLTGYLIPTLQEIKLQPFLEEGGNFSIKGETRIYFTCMNATNIIELHMSDIITINETIFLKDIDHPNETMVFVNHEYDPSAEMYRGTLEEPMVVGEHYYIEIGYEGYLNDKLIGFYRSSYVDANGTTVNIGTTQMEPVDARRAFPCFDEPAFKSMFDVVIHHQDFLPVALSNMATESDVTYPIPDPDQPGWLISKYITSVPMSSYLVAFVVSDFVSLSTNVQNDARTLFRVWARSEAIDQAQYSLTVGPLMLAYYEGYYNVSYPLSKQDMIALPDFDAGAMENWGLITYRETAMLYDPVQSSASNHQRVTDVIAHELAHMWFGDLVTMDWWSDLWLNEGFASYMQYLGTEAAEPEYRIFDQFTINELLYALEIDSKESSRPISFDVENTVEISQMFDGISYSKGASIIRMLKYMITETAFSRGLTNYLNDFSYDNANPDDLWRKMSLSAQTLGTLPVSPVIGVKGIMHTWTTQMGYPVINVTLGADIALITQERFLLVQNESSADTHDYKWWIPITWTNNISPDFDQQGVVKMMRDTEASTTVNDVPTAVNWTIFNVDQSAFYRVNYRTKTNWLNLFSQLKEDHLVLSINTRVQLIDDLMNLARAIPNYQTYDLALNVNDYLVNEREYAPWVAALENLEYLEEMFTLSNEYILISDYILSLLTPLYNNVTFTDSLQDNHVLQLTRSLAVSWACHLEYSDCVTKSTAIFSTWMLDPNNNPILPNLKSSVYCTAVSEGDTAEWNFEYNRYLVENLGSEIDYLLAGMGCSKNQTILENYLDITFMNSIDGSPIRRQDAYKVYRSVANNDYGNDLAWTYLTVNWDAMAAYVGIAEMTSYLNYAANEFNTQAKLDEVIALKELRKDELGSSVSDVDQTIETINNNINWMNDYYDVIVTWLEQNANSTSY